MDDLNPDFATPCIVFQAAVNRQLELLSILRFACTTHLRVPFRYDNYTHLAGIYKIYKS